MAAFEVLYYLSGFNNYYNRTIKLAEANHIEAYEEWVLKYDAQVSFNPNDNVTTTHVVNYVIKNDNGETELIPDETDIDYVILVDKENNIVSRWFVIDRQRLLSGQWNLELRRDLIADYYQQILNSPVFIEKGFINNIGSRFLFNNENMQYNQIKKKEVLLKDKTGVPWIVGYMSNDYYKGLQASGTSRYVEFNRDIERTTTYSYSYSELASLGTIYTGATINNQDLSVALQYGTLDGGVRIYQKREPWDDLIAGHYNFVFNGDPKHAVEEVPKFTNIFRSTNPYFIAPREIKNYITGYITNIEYLRQLNGNMIKNTDNEGPRFFYFSLNPAGIDKVDIIPPLGSDVYQEIKNYIQNDVMANFQYRQKFIFDDGRQNGFKVEVNLSSYTVFLSEQAPDLTARAVLADVDGENVIDKKQELNDAPYTMFCIPYDDYSVHNNDISFISKGTVCREMASSLSKQLGGGGSTSYIYDLQLLPYCPFENILDDEDKIDLTNISEKNFSYIINQDSEGNFPITGCSGIILFPEKSSFYVPLAMTPSIDVPNDPVEFKVKNETEFCRIVSPNYSGAFEFNPMKNGGLYLFEANCTYKPFQPYIHINPKFNTGSLYGGDFDDNRGLVCGGDFSLPQTTNAWINYQIQNRSYKESFDRQIEHIEVNNSVQREREIWQAAAGSVAGIAGGAMLGSKAGPYGSVVGAIIGGGAAIAGGIRDIQLSEKLRSESLDYTKDQFGYNLQNIKALPTTMSRTSSFDINNKLFPFVEFYSCSEEEKIALKKKIIYNGMTVMLIGTIGNFLAASGVYDNGVEIGTYIKGQIIRLSGTAEFHETNEIANELNKGVFFYK